MRSLLSGRNRYALACLVAVGGLLTAAASCEPTKTPVKLPPPTGLSIDPTSHDFGSKQLADPAPVQDFVVTNNGPNESGNPSFEISGAGDFQVPSDSCNAPIAVGGTCFIQVSFEPGAPAGLKQGELSVSTDNPDDGTATATLTGTLLP